MKTKLFIVVITTLFIFTERVFASDDKYIQAMKKSIDALYAAKSTEELRQSINALDRIAQAEKTKWEPYYYIAFGYIRMANTEKEPGKKDEDLDQAMKAIESANALNPNSSEIVTLEGFAYMIRVTVDPASRGPQFAGLAMQTFSKAKSIDPENPRALALMAEMQYGTAQFFGSPATEACKTLAEALQKFETFKSENPLAPMWGKNMAEGLKQLCQ